jgi:drug/metabolite transporter (DMT)-like permease
VGSTAALISFVLQAIALTMGSVVLVQSLQVTALLFALPIDARLSRHRLTRWEWMWAVLRAGGVAVIVVAGDPTAGHSRAPLSAWAVVATAMVPALLLCVVGARVFSGAKSAALLALGSAATLAVFTVLTLTVARPLIASVLGVTVLGEVVHAGEGQVVTLVIAVAVVVVATVALARDEAAMMDAPTADMDAPGRLAVP